MHTNDTRLIICRSDLADGGWSLHAPGSTDDDIAEGVALPLVTGTGPITDAHRAAALAVLVGGDAMKTCRNCGQPVPPEDQRSYLPWADWITHLSPSCCAIAVIRARTTATLTPSDAK